MNEAAELARIRDRLRNIEPGGWMRAYDGDDCYVETAGPDGEIGTLARFDRNADPAEIEFVCEAPRMVRFLLGLVDRAITRARRDNPAPARPPAALPHVKQKNFAAEAGMRCQEPAFLVFLEERHGLERPLTSDRAAQKLRSILGIGSRKELNTDANAAEKWRQLRGNFENWKRAG